MDGDGATIRSTRLPGAENRGGYWIVVTASMQIIVLGGTCLWRKNSQAPTLCMEEGEM